MTGITGIGTTFNLPNYHGELFSLTPADTPLLSAIGGLTGGGQTTATEFEWETYDLRDPDQRTKTEGATAPTAESRVRANVSNVCQIHQEKASVTYTKQAATGAYSGLNVAGAANPVTNELNWQVTQHLKQIARDVNWSFINGLYQKPADNTTPRKTRGILAAVTTNLIDKGTNVASGASSATDTITPAAAHSLVVADKVVFTSVGAMAGVVVGRVYWVTAIGTTVNFKVALTSGGAAIAVGTSTANVAYHSLSATVLDIAQVNNLAQIVFDNGGLTDGLGTFVVNSTQKIALTAAFAGAYLKANPRTSGEKIGGVAVEQVITDFGTLNIMLDRAMPRDAIALVSLSQLRPVFLNTPGKGVFFEEPLAKTGASDDVQIYGEIGLEYGAPISHGLLRGLPAT
jgi:hypothetical protein